MEKEESGEGVRVLRGVEERRLVKRGEGFEGITGGRQAEPASDG